MMINKRLISEVPVVKKDMGKNVFYQWFISTKLYKDNLESFVHGKGMTKKAKVRVVSIISLTMAFGFLMMKNVPIGRIILLFVWVFHILYFAYGIKTLNEANE